jgi:hypothetical protein
VPCFVCSRFGSWIVGDARACTLLRCVVYVLMNVCVCAIDRVRERERERERCACMHACMHVCVCVCVFKRRQLHRG